MTDKIFWYLLRDQGTDKGDWFQNQGVRAPRLVAEARARGVPGPRRRGSGHPQGGGGAGGGTGSARRAPAGTPRSCGAARAPHAGPFRRRRVALGTARLTSRRGSSLVFTVRCSGGSTKVRIEGYRARRWRLVTTVKVPRSGKVTLRFRDKGYLGFRLRATIPGRSGFRVGRVVRIPAALRQPPTAEPDRSSGCPP